MTEAILVALITGGLSLAGVIVTCMATARKTERTAAIAQAVTDAKIEELTREVRLHNGKFKTFEFDVTDQLLGQPRGGVIVVDGIEIPDKEGTEGGGTFDPEVDKWGDYIDIPLPIN